MTDGESIRRAVLRVARAAAERGFLVRDDMNGRMCRLSFELRGTDDEWERPHLVCSTWGYDEEEWLLPTDRRSLISQMRWRRMNGIGLLDKAFYSMAYKALQAVDNKRI